MKVHLKMDDNRQVERFGWGAVKVLFAAVVLSLAINPASKGRQTGQRQGSETVLPAQIRASQFLDVIAPETGRIVELPVAPGQKITAGQVLAVIENAELTAALERARTRAQIGRLRAEGSPAPSNGAQAEWMEEQRKAAERSVQAAAERLKAYSISDAEQALEAARSKAAKVRDLAKRQLATSQEVENAETIEKNEARNLAARRDTGSRLEQELQAAESQLKMVRLQAQSLTAAPASPEAAKLDLEDALSAVKSLEMRQAALRLVAPWDGTVLRVNGVQGSIAVGGTPLVQMADTGTLDFDTLVPASIARTVRPGDPVKVRIPLDPPREIASRVSRVLLQPNAGQPSYVIRVTMPNPAPDTVLVGLEGSVSFEH